MTNQERIDQIIAAVKLNRERPGYKPLTSQQMREREDRQRAIATSIKLSGGRVNLNYE